MQFSVATRTASLSVGEFADFALGPREGGSTGSPGIWRAQLGQHWHNELRAQTESAHTKGGVLHPDVQFEVPLEGALTHRGWTLTLGGRIDQLVGSTLREIKTVLRPLPADEPELRTEHPAYFLQLATYLVLVRTASIGGRLATIDRAALRGEIVFVEASSGLAQTLALTAFDEALVHHQLDAVVEFLELQRRAADRRRHLNFQSPFPALRPGQETIQQDLTAAFGFSAPAPDLAPSTDSPGIGPADRSQHGLPFAEQSPPGLTPADAPSPVLTPATQSPACTAAARSQIQDSRSKIVLLEAPTGYGKTGFALEFGLTQLRLGHFDRLIWLTGKSTGQLQVVETLRRMISPRAPTSRPAPCHLLGDKATRATTATAPSESAANCHLLGDNGSGTLAFWQVRNKGEHCVNDVFHCVRDGCAYLHGAADRWPQSGLARFYTDTAQPRDLEQLRRAGREARICPYEITRTALGFNDVWIGDYNYVFAPDNRGLFFDQPGFDARRTLLLVDEAHNLPSRVADAYSHRASDGDARALLAELDYLRAPAPLLLAVEAWARTLAQIAPCEILDGAHEADVRDALSRLAELVGTTPLDYAALGPQHAETLWQFPKLADFLADSRLHRLLWSRHPGALEFTCVDASAAIAETLGQFGGTLLMSATLAPFDSFAASCGLAADEFTSLRAPAPWRQGAYDVAVDLRVSTTLRERAHAYGLTAATLEDVQAAAGRAIVAFFPSYAFAEAVQRALENSGSVLRVSMQPKLPDLAAQAAWVEETLAFADALFLVLGSSFAESIDLLGGRVSHAVVVGPALPEVNAVQKARLDSLSGLGRDAAFRRVYQIPGLQKVNQALGRLVRGPGQSAKILLHCRRFADPSYAALLDRECQMYREIASTADLHEWLRPPQG